MFCGFNKQIGDKLSPTLHDYRKSTTHNKAGICRLGNVDLKRLFRFLEIVANQLKLCSKSKDIVVKGLEGEQRGSRNMMPRNRVMMKSNSTFALNFIQNAKYDRR